MTLRNEDPARAFLRLKTVKNSLDATGFGEQFAYFVLSDTNSDSVAADEEAAFAAWKAGREKALTEEIAPRARSAARSAVPLARVLAVWLEV